MLMWWPVRAMTRFWGWVILGLIALEPGAMAFHEASRETGESPRRGFDR
jgi:hypothetical protein